MRAKPLIRTLALAALTLLLRETRILNAQVGIGDQCIKQFETDSGPLCNSCCSNQNDVTFAVGSEYCARPPEPLRRTS
jgi:hypothetical protein